MNLDAYKQELLKPSARQARREACQVCADSIQRCGDALWAFGMVDDARRRALATVLQMGGGLAKGCVAMLIQSNWYAAAALSRQLVEIEYLVWLFGTDPEEGKAWLSVTQKDLRRTYNPSAMRKRSEGQFRDREYWSHCEIGGHPNPRAAFLLSDRLLPNDSASLAFAADIERRFLPEFSF